MYYISTKKDTQKVKKLILPSKSFSLSSEMFKDFSWTIREKLIKISSRKWTNYCFNYSNLGHKSTQCVKLGIMLFSLFSSKQEFFPQLDQVNLWLIISIIN